MIDQKQPKNVEYLNYVDSMIKNVTRCTRGIKSKIALAKAALKKKKILFTNNLELLYCFLGYSPASEFCADVSEYSVCSIFIGGVSRKKLREYHIRVSVHH